MKRGQSFLALVVMIGAVVAVVGVLVAFLASSFEDTGYGLSAQASAQAAAQSGAEDALLQFSRNGVNWIPSPANPYTLPVGSTTVSVTVTQNSPSSGYAMILSSAAVGGRTGKVSVVLSENSSTEQVSVVSWQEVQ